MNQAVTATTAPVNAGYAFASWTGGPVTPGSGAGAGGAVGTVVMDGPKSVTANFNVAYTVTTVPEGLSVMVDWVTYTTPQDVWLGSGVGSLDLCLSPSRRRRVRRGRGMSIRVGATVSRQFHWLTMPQASTTYTATFGKQYSLTTASNPAVGGSVSPAGVSWWNAGATTTGVTATANPGYQFTGWSGASTSTANPAPGMVMDGPKVLTANFGKAWAYTVTSVPSGRQVLVDGVTYTTPTGVHWLPGTSHTIGVTSPQAGVAGTRYLYQGWSDQGAQSHTVTAPQTAFDVYGDVWDSACGDGVGESLRCGDVDAQSCGDRGGGRPELVCGESDGDGDDGSGECGICLCELDGGPVTPGSGAGAGGAVGTVVMDGPKSVTANFNVAYTVTTVPEGLSVMVDWVTYTTPQDVWLGAGVGVIGFMYYHRHRRRRVSRGRGMSIRAGVTDRRQFHWLTMPQTSTTYTATFGKQYSLTTASNPAVGGSVTPAGVSWWNAGATATGVTATANPGYQFTGWSGASTSTANPVPGIVMDGPKVVDGELWEGVGVYGDERSFGPPGVGGRGDVHDADR